MEAATKEDTGRRQVIGWSRPEGQRGRSQGRRHAEDASQSDVRSLEPYLRDASVNYHTWLTYSFLVRSKPTAFSFPAPDAVIPDGAQSWEYSPDKLTLTFKLQPDDKWDSRAPTNGRAVDAEDVVYSWKQLEAISSIRAELANSVSPTAPIISSHGDGPADGGHEAGVPAGGAAVSAT